MIRAKSKHADKGKWAEGVVEEWLDASARRLLGFNWHRMPDSRSARNAIGKQPADYLVGLKTLSGAMQAVHKRTWWLELKETKEERRLPRAKVSQYGMLNAWRHSSIEPVVLVYRSTLGIWSILYEEDLFKPEYADDPPASFPLTGPTFTDHHTPLSLIFGV